MILRSSFLILMEIDMSTTTNTSALFGDAIGQAPAKLSDATSAFSAAYSRARKLSAIGAEERINAALAPLAEKYGLSLEEYLAL
jgi:hypothetical protein